MHTDRHQYSAGALSPPERANLIAGKVVAHATAFLDGRHDDVEQLGRHAESDMLQLYCEDDLRAKAILDAARLLVIAMLGCSNASDDARRDRWMQVMGAMVELVKMESTELKRTGAQRS